MKCELWREDKLDKKGIVKLVPRAGAEYNIVVARAAADSCIKCCQLLIQRFGVCRSGAMARRQLDRKVAKLVTKSGSSIH